MTIVLWLLAGLILVGLGGVLLLYWGLSILYLIVTEEWD